MLNRNNLPTIFRTWGRLYAVTLFFVIFASSLFWLDSFRIYEAEINILVIGKTGVTGTDIVVENFAALTQNLSFYERILTRSNALNDEFEGHTKDKRKALWNETLHAKRNEKSGILTLVARKDSAEEAKVWVEATAEELFSVAGFYYNIKTDIDMRVVDGPIVNTAVKNPVLYVFVSLLSGLLFTTLFFWLLTVVPFLLGGKKKGERAFPRETEKGPREMAYPKYNIGDSVPLIDPKKFIPSRPTSLSFESHKEAQVEKTVTEEASRGIKKASAPANLPTASDETNLPGVSMEDLPFQFEDQPEDKDSFEENKTPRTFSGNPEEQKKPEPTVEEYKRRLNELLKGGK